PSALSSTGLSRAVAGTRSFHAGGADFTDRAMMASVRAGQRSVTFHVSPVRRAISSVKTVGAIFSAAGRSPSRTTTVALEKSSVPAWTGSEKLVKRPTIKQAAMLAWHFASGTVSIVRFRVRLIRGYIDPTVNSE